MVVKNTQKCSQKAPGFWRNFNLATTLGRKILWESYLLTYSQLVMKNNFWLNTTFDETQIVMKHNLWSNASFDDWQLEMKHNFWQNTNILKKKYICIYSKSQLWQNIKSQIVTKHNFKLWQNLKSIIVTKFKISNCDKTQNLKLWQNSKSQNASCESTQIVTKLKLWRVFC